MSTTTTITYELADFLITQALHKQEEVSGTIAVGTGMGYHPEAVLDEEQDTTAILQYTLTHLPSGLLFTTIRPTKERTMRRMLEAVLPLADWTCSHEELKALPNWTALGMQIRDTMAGILKEEEGMSVLLL